MGVRFERQPFRSQDSHFSSGAPTEEEAAEWDDWHKDYKEEDFFKAYIAEVKNIPNCDASALVKYWQRHKDMASFNRLIRAHLKIVPKIAYRIANEYGFMPSYDVIRDRKKAKQGYETVVADLICAGNIGLLETPRRYRPDAGAAFVTAAYKSIEKEMRDQARFIRHVVHVPEGKKSPWYKSLTCYDDEANEYEGETDIAVGGVAVSAYQIADGATDADPVDPTIGLADISQPIRAWSCLADLEQAANSLPNKRERSIFKAHYIHGKTLKALATKYGIGFQRVSKIARSARDKILKMDFAIGHVNFRAVLPQWNAGEVWLDALRRRNDVELIRTRGRLARLWEPHERYYELFGFPFLNGRVWHDVFPLETANKLALWRLAEHEREDDNVPEWNRFLIASVNVPEKMERWRRRKTDVEGLWDPLIPLWHPPVVPALWTTRSTYPARIHVAGKPQWIGPSPNWRKWPNLVSWFTPRPKWREPLKTTDWQFAYQRRKCSETLELLFDLKKAA